jgi:membrane fusion protein
MEWQSEGVILSMRPHGESAAIIEVLTALHGRHAGVVREISRVALPPQDVVQHIKVEEPVYVVRVSLPADHMIYQGKKLPITPGMVLEADVELDRLKIYQWLLEPLYRLGGRV